MDLMSAKSEGIWESLTPRENRRQVRSFPAIQGVSLIQPATLRPAEETCRSGGIPSRFFSLI
jgi:hypothetical protein